MVHNKNVDKELIEVLSKIGYECDNISNIITDVLNKFGCTQFVAQVKLPNLGKNENKNIITAAY